MPMDRNTGKRISDLEHVDQCIVNILSTSKGARVMDPGYGADLIGIVDSTVNATGEAMIRAETLIPVREYEPRPEYKTVRLQITDPDGVHTTGEVDVEIGYVFDDDEATTVTRLFAADDPEAPTDDFVLPKDLPVPL